MSYIEKHLGADEHIVHKVRFPIISYVMAWAALILLGALIIGIIIFVIMMYRMQTTEIVVTDQRFILKTGWLNVEVRQMQIDQIEDINFSQSFFGRIFNYGVVRVHGTGEDTVITPTIADPAALASALTAAHQAIRRAIASQGKH